MVLYIEIIYAYGELDSHSKSSHTISHDQNDSHPILADGYSSRTMTAYYARTTWRMAVQICAQSSVKRLLHISKSAPESVLKSRLCSRITNLSSKSRGILIYLKCAFAASLMSPPQRSRRRLCLVPSSSRKITMISRSIRRQRSGCRTARHGAPLSHVRNPTLSILHHVSWVPSNSPMNKISLHSFN